MEYGLFVFLGKTSYGKNVNPRFYEEEEENKEVPHLEPELKLIISNEVNEPFFVPMA